MLAVACCTFAMPVRADDAVYLGTAAVTNAGSSPGRMCNAPLENRGERRSLHLRRP
jgi:hypothetical protein